MADALGSFLGGAGAGVIGKAIVQLELDTAKYQAEMRAAQAETVSSTNTMAASLSKVGTIGLAGLGLLGGIAVKLALDFDRSFTRIAAITNTSGEAIEGMKESVLSLSGETAQAPTELADALFFLSSAGLDAGQVMPALEAAAKGSAVGLGETADVANIVASALNAYSKSGLTAARATDILVAAVREGRAEPEEFANALGRILPIASTVGVTFDQVAASMAALSNIGLDVNEGVTAMRGVLQAIAAPGTMAAEALDKLGLSSQQLLDVISEDGIIGAIRLLDETAQQQTNTQADYNNVLRQIIPNVRSLTGVLGLTAQEAEKVDGIFQAVLNSSGDLAAAFRTTAEQESFQLQKSLNDVAVEATRLGGDLLPQVVRILKVLGPAVGFAARNFELLVAAFLGMKAVAFVPKLLSAIATGIGEVSLGAAGFTAGGGFIAGIGALAAALPKLATSAPMAAAGIVEFWEALHPTENFATPIIEANVALSALSESAQADIAFIGMHWEDAGRSAESFQTQIDSINEALADAGIKYTLTTGALEALANEQSITGLGAGQLVEAQEKVAEIMDKAGPAARRFGITSKAAFSEFKEGVVSSTRVAIGQFKNLNEVFSVTPDELRTQLRTAIAIARRFGSDLKAILSDKSLTTEQKKALAELPPEYRRAFVEAGKEGKQQLAQDAVTLANLNKRNWGDFATKAKPAARQGGKETGAAMMSGAVTGIVEGAGAVRRAAEAAVLDAIQAAKDAAKVESPSKVMRVLGLDMMQGLSDGISDGAQHVIDIARDVLDKAIDEIGAQLDKIKGKASGFSDSIRSGFSEFLDIGGRLEDFGGNLDATIMAALGGASQLADVLKELKRQGAGKALLAQVAENPELGSALLAGGREQINEANEALKEIAELSRQTGKALSEQFFGNKIEKLEGKLDRLHDDLKELTQVERQGHSHDIVLEGEKVSTTTERGLTRILDRRGSLFDGAVRK
jgi:TP901 family phage tail tape measure protein